MDTHYLMKHAAMAADYTFVSASSDGKQTYVTDQRGVYFRWSPLHDNGDCLSLAILLHFTVKIGKDKTEIISEDGRVVHVEPHFQKPHKATRRAIVVAAAKTQEETVIKSACELLQDGLLAMKKLVDNAGKNGEMEAILEASVWTVEVTKHLKEL